VIQERSLFHDIALLDGKFASEGTEMNLLWGKKELVFHQVTLYFDADGLENVFADKNNKTLRQTLAHRRYKKYEAVVVANYLEYLEWPLGKFLLHLKSSGDNFYLKFLNKYGDKRYCQFCIEDERFLYEMGLYVYTVSAKPQYIGRCRDSFKKRINRGYGKIHPKNCYLDGQATNCHLNALIAEYQVQVALWVHVMDDKDMITRAEKGLIVKYNPPWNIAR